jgi:predicted nucleic acid-binding protein
LIAVDTNLWGRRIFDLQIAVIALEHGQEIWTHDRNFVSVPAVKVHDLLERA